MWPFLNNVTTTCEQNYCTPASSICYTGSNLSCIGVNQNDTLSVALQKINALMCEPISSTEIIEALGYTPADNLNVLHTVGNEVKNGSLTVITSYVDAPVAIAGFSDTLSGVLGYSGSGGGIDGLSNTGIGVQGFSQTGLGGKFSTFSGTKIVSFLTNAVEQAYILATGLFKANKILVNTVVDNGIDALQVEGSANITADIRVNDLTIGKGNGNNPNNTAIGVYSLVNNTTGFDNTAIGLQTMYSNTTGGKNIAIGLNSLSSNITGDQNIAIGHAANTLNDTDSNSIVIGAGRLGLGSNTTVIGTPETTLTRLRGAVQGGSFVKDSGLPTEFLKADGSTTTSVMLLVENQSIDGIKNFQKDLVVNGINIGRGGGNPIGNVAVGQSALSVNTIGNANTAIGRHALISNTIGNENTANGHQALFSNTSGSNNTASGSYALIYNTTGSFNTAIGQSAFFNNTTGSNNVALGQRAGAVIGDKITLATILNNSIILGFNASPLDNNQTNQIVIGHNATGLGSDTSVIGNSSTTVTGLYGNIRLVSGMATAPASATAPGTLGDIRVTAGFIYVCIATNTWVRTALTTWV